MRKRIVEYGESMTAVQRLLRLQDAILRRDSHRISEEISNVGHVNWNPVDHPYWLLLEIEANILIRKDQVDVALATVAPASGSNSVLQMNMGQGKTSCIMPMVAAELADKKRPSQGDYPQSFAATDSTTTSNSAGWAARSSSAACALLAENANERGDHQNICQDPQRDHGIRWCHGCPSRAYPVFHAEWSTKVIRWTAS
jgi:hypothetical protein